MGWDGNQRGETVLLVLLEQTDYLPLLCSQDNFDFYGTTLVRSTHIASSLECMYSVPDEVMEKHAPEYE